MDYESVKLSIDYLGLDNPFRDTDYQFYMLIEVSGNQEYELIENKMLELFEKLDGNFEDAILAQNETEINTLWQIREGVSLATASYGITFKYDVSLGSDQFWDLCSKTNDRIGDDGIVLGHGHIGDGNLHLNCAMPGFEDHERAMRLHKSLEPFVFDYIKDVKGSISAEHGIGLLKAPYLNHSKSQDLIDYMKNIKDLFDPNGILNPYKVLPQQNL